MFPTLRVVHPVVPKARIMNSAYWYDSTPVLQYSSTPVLLITGVLRLECTSTLEYWSTPVPDTVAYRDGNERQLNERF